MILLLAIIYDLFNKSVLPILNIENIIYYKYIFYEGFEK